MGYITICVAFALWRVAEALRELEVSADDLEPTQRQDAGVFVVDGQDAAGRRLLVKVYGSDAYDNQLFAKLWRRLMYRDGGPELGLSRGQAVEHEAFVTLLDAKAGVPTLEAVTAGNPVTDDAVLVLRGSARPFASLEPDELSREVLMRSWRALALLSTFYLPPTWGFFALRWLERARYL